MKYVFLAGLEHSGTTLISQLLSASEGVVAMGEVGQFLSRSHMRQYLARWGAYEDVTRCSCGLDWSDCPFWSELMPLSGAFDDAELSFGYAEVLRHLDNSGGFDVFVDSSKSHHCLKALRQAVHQLDARQVEIMLLLLAKNPPGFADSIGNKKENGSSVLSYWRAMNWWRGEYQRMLDDEGMENTDALVITYEQLCKQTQQVLSAISKRLDISLEPKPDLAHKLSHIALGNKDFTERNRQQVRYDDAWTRNGRARLAYAVNLPAFLTYRRIKRLSQNFPDQAIRGEDSPAEI